VTTEQLQAAIHAVPFLPFVLRVADGQQLRVPHPDFIAHRPGARTAVVWMPDDSIKIVDFLLVGTLDIEQPAPR
jgi:hypothetical protein